MDWSSVDWHPLWLSLQVSLLATGVSLVVAIVAAYVLSFGRFPGRNWVDAVVTLPLALPPTVLGYYLLLTIGRQGPLGRMYEAVFGEPVVFTVKAAVIAACLHAAPLMIKMLRASFESIDPGYLRVARSLGASDFKVLWRVLLPLARRGVLAATALAFARSLGDFGATIMVAGNIPGSTKVVSVAIYEAVESGNGEVARVLVIAVSVLAFALVLLSNHFAYRNAARS